MPFMAATLSSLTLAHSSISFLSIPHGAVIRLTEAVSDCRSPSNMNWDFTFLLTYDVCITCVVVVVAAAAILFILAAAGAEA